MFAVPSLIWSCPASFGGRSQWSHCWSAWLLEVHFLTSRFLARLYLKWQTKKSPTSRRFLSSTRLSWNTLWPRKKTLYLLMKVSYEAKFWMRCFLELQNRGGDRKFEILNLRFIRYLFKLYFIDGCIKLTISYVRRDVPWT